MEPMYYENYSLSLSDLMLVEGFAEAFGKDDKEAIEAFLFANGMDVVNLPYSSRYCTHRNLQNKIISCIGYDGGERCDSEWLNSGAASLNAVIESNQDYSMRAELRNISRTQEGVGVRSYQE